MDAFAASNVGGMGIRTFQANSAFTDGDLRLRPGLIRASRVLPSTLPLFHNVERHSWMF